MWSSSGNASGSSHSGMSIYTPSLHVVIVCLHRPYVKSLTEGLKGVATFKGFDSFQIAAENYNKAKSIGVVRIMRLQGDDFRYGPKSEGMQDAIDTILL
jgi:hypothetical protein